LTGVSPQATTSDHLPINRTPDFIHYANELRKMGRKEGTIAKNIERFLRLSKLVQDINDPEQVKEALAKVQWANSTKGTAADAYTVYLRTIGKQWIKPRYIRQEKIYFIPTEQEVDALIASANKKLAALLQLLKEIAARIGEAYAITWTDVDLEHKTVTINHPEKGSLPRILPISEKLKGMINALPRDTDKPFQWLSKKTHKPIQQKGIKETFEGTRARAAKKLNNPRLLQIHFHTFRHWKATTDYYKTRDDRMIRHVLGHKTATMTDRYIHIVETLYHDESGEWTCKVAHTEKEAIELIEQGFTYVNNLGDTTALYRKRK
jgi:integrase